MNNRRFYIFFKKRAISVIQLTLVFSIALFLFGCNAVKNVNKDEYLLTKNSIIVDGKITKDERINNILLQKPNSKIPLINLPLKLHIYNLARQNRDSIFETWLDEGNRRQRLTNKLSKKQLSKLKTSALGFNNALRRSGEAPRILDEDRAEKSKNRLSAYFYQRGFLYNEVDYTIEKDSNQRANVKYNVTKNSPSILDTLSTTILTPAVDSVYKLNKNQSLLKAGQQYDDELFTAERNRINTLMRNSGFYYFGQDYVRFEIDTFKQRGTHNAELFIDNRIVRENDSTKTQPFKVFNIKSINIVTDATNENLIKAAPITDSIVYNNFNIYSFDKLKFNPKALTDAVFVQKDSVYKDLERRRTLRYLSQLQMFRSPGIDYIPNEQDSTLTANIYLSPLKKYDLGYSFDISQSNIQTIGFGFSTGLKIRNIFRGAETLDISLLGAIGSSRNPSEDQNTFFDINEFGGSVALTIPRLFVPFRTERIIPKYMSPSTKINISATSQRNIGLDRQTLSSVFAYNWFPSETVTNNLDLLDIRYIKNLNVNNYFGVFSNSFERLNVIARNINYIAQDQSLQDSQLEDQFSPADLFIDDVLNGNTSLSVEDSDFIDVNNISQRQERLTEDNLIISTNFDFKKDTRESLSDNTFYTFKYHTELAGNLLGLLSNVTGRERNENNRYELLNVAFSQYFKTELDFVKYFGFSSKRNVLAFRGYFGVAIPFGNSSNIPFVESFFAGGPNDNRAWTPFDLGPGRSQSTNEFNEANLKLHFSLEQRFNLFGNFDGAIFADAGNIWNAFGNVENDPESTFTNLKSLRDIAVGTGFGLRYDFTFFVLRGDIGFKTHDPSLNEGNRWFKNYNFSNATYNIGINYPF